MTVFTYQAPIGILLISVNSDAIFSVSITDKKLPKPPYKPVIAKIIRYFDGYFKGENPNLDFDIIVSGTEFEKKVYSELLKIPYGKTATYKQIAAKVFDKNPCAQAVGRAIGKNRLLIVVPCHRVIANDGSLLGFRYGLEVKKQLLDIEARPLT